MFSIHQMSPAQITFMRVGVEDTLQEAVTFASRYHGLTKPNITLTVEIEGTGVPVASFSTRRILGDFEKQSWGGHKGNDALSCGDERFDATLHILSMPYEQVIQIKDDHDTSDNIGQAHVDWRGPYTVNIVDSMCDFFGVSKLAEISADHFNFVVRSRQQEIQDHRSAAQQRLQPPTSTLILTPAESARELILSLAKLALPGEAGPTGQPSALTDPATAQAHLNALIRQSRQIVAEAEAFARQDALAAHDDANDQAYSQSTRH